jgi:hypothetical protein
MAQKLRVVSSPKLQPEMPPRKLLTRKLTALVLSTSVSTVSRLEKAGRLRAIKLNAENGPTFYAAAEVDALAQAADDEVV